MSRYALPLLVLIIFAALSSTVGAGVTIMAGNTVFSQGLSYPIAGECVDAKYQWQFGDRGGAYNDLTGFNVAHTYDSAGVFPGSLTITDISGTAQTITDSVVVTPDTRQVIRIAASGTDKNNGSIGHEVKTLARATQLASSNARIQFRCGDVFDAVGISRALKNVIIESYGSGAKPRLRWKSGGGDSIIGSSTSSVDVTIQNLAFDSVSTKAIAPNAISAAGSRIMIRNNDVYNVGYFVLGNAKPSGCFVVDNKTMLPTGQKKYFCWINGNDWVVLGNLDNESQDEHCLRAAGGAQRINSQFNRFTNIDQQGPGISKGTETFQNVAYVYSASNVLRCVSGDSVKNRGGDEAFGPLAADVRGARTRYFVSENDTFYGGAEDIVRYGTEHGRIRNNRAEDFGRPMFVVDPSNRSSDLQKPVDVMFSGNTSFARGTNP
jgi:PKD repeat protein